VASNESSKQSKQLEKYRASIEARHALRKWYQSPLGKALAEQECRVLSDVVPNVFGYHLLQVSNHMDSSYLDDCLIRHKLIVDMDDENSSVLLNMRSDASKLAITSDSVDAVILQHTLDVDMAPHLVLREMERILVPEGKIVVLGFNPWSSWGMRHVTNLWHGRTPWKLRFISPSRIKDWLVLLGFEIENVETFFFRLPLTSPFIVRKSSFLDKLGGKAWPAFGAVYVMVAKKQVSTLTPIRPRWFLRRRSGVLPGFIETIENNVKKTS